MQSARHIGRRMGDDEPRGGRVGLGRVETLVLPRSLPAILDAVRGVQRLHHAIVTSGARGLGAGLAAGLLGPDEVTQRLWPEYAITSAARPAATRSGARA